MGINLKLSLKSIIIFCVLIILFLPPFFSEGNNDFVLALICFILGIILILLAHSSWRNNIIYFVKFKFSLKLPLLISLAFIFFLLIANLFSTTPYLSWFYFLEILIYVLIFLVLSSLPLSGNFFKTFSFILIGGTLILSLIGIYFYETGLSNIIASTFYNPNAFAGYLLFSLPFALYFLMEAKKREFLFLFLAIVLFSSFILTNSQGAFISFIPSFILLIALFLKKGQKKKVLKKLLILLIGCFILVNFLFYLKEHETNLSFTAKSILTSPRQLESSTSDRLDFWKGSISMFKEKPVFGWGLSSFSTIYPRYQSSAISYAKYTHNYYLAILGETGIFGAITFYAFISSLIYLGFKAFRSAWSVSPQSSNSKKEILISIFFLSILSSIIHSGFDFDWHFRANFITFFVLAGLFLNFNRQFITKHEQQAISNEQKGAPFIRYSLIASGLIFILISLILFYSFNHFKQGEEFEARGNYSSAILAYREGTRINPHPHFLLKEGFLLFSNGELEQSEEIAKKLKKLSPGDKGLWFLLGKIETEKQNPIAENHFKKVISINPYFINGYIELSRFYLKEGETNKASKILDKAIEKHDEDSIQYFKEQCQAQTLTEDSQLREMMRCFKFLNKIVDLYIEKGEVEKMKGNEKEAEFFFKKAEEIRINHLGN